jgi:hypothetical protein
MNMDTQQAFEMAVKHLRKQGCRSGRVRPFNGSMNCLYRLPESNLKCAVGALIPDELYQQSFEGTSIVGLIDTFDDLNSLFKDVNLKLLEDLQNVHDNSEVTNWENELKELSIVYKLTMPEEDEH